MPELSAISELYRLAANLQVPRGCQLLAFGSSVHGTVPSDLDLLIVYDPAARPGARKLADELEQLPELGLVHVTMLTLEEEAGMSFAVQVSATHVAGEALVGGSRTSER